MINIILMISGIFALLAFVISFLIPMYIVEGNSMIPTFNKGDILITKRLFNKTLQVSEVYVFKGKKYTDKQYVIKRLTVLDERGYCYFTGDNPDESFDSRHYGYVNPKEVIAKVIWKKES